MPRNKPTPVNGGTLPQVNVYGTAPNRVSAIYDGRSISDINDEQSRLAALMRQEFNYQPEVSPWSSVLSRLAPFLGVIGSLVSDHLQHKRQLEYMDKAHQQAIERWQLENQYNLPSAVKSRLIAAGLNPNLMYGTPAGGAVAGSVGSPSVPEAFAANPMGLIAQLMQSSTNQEVAPSVMESNFARAEESRASAQKQIAQKSEIGANIERMGILNRLTDKQISHIDSQIDLISQQIRNMSVEEIREHAKLIQDIVDAQYSVASLQDRLNLTHAQAVAMSADAQFLVKTLQTRINREGITTAQAQAELDCMAGQLFQAAVYRQYYTIDENGNYTLTAVGRSRYKTDLAFDRIEQGIDMVGHAVGTYGALRYAAGMLKNQRESNQLKRTELDHKIANDAEKRANERRDFEEVTNAYELYPQTGTPKNRKYKTKKRTYAK